jgi:hypothetical protein
MAPPRVATALLLTLLAPAAQGVGFAADLPFTDLATADRLPILGGSLDVKAPAGGAPTLMHNVTAFEVGGLAVVCWQYPCHRATGALSVLVHSGSTVALRYPQTGDLHLVAEHAVAAPVLLDSEKSGFGGLSAGMRLAPSLVAATEVGRLTLETELLPPAQGGPVPAQAPPGLPPATSQLFQPPDPDDTNGAVLAALTPRSRIQVVDAGRVVHDFSGYGGLILQGAVSVEPVAAEAFVLPCAVVCDVRVGTQGSPPDLEAAAASILELVEVAQGRALPPIGFGPYADLLDPLADGVYLSMPLLADPSGFSVGDLTVARFDRFSAQLRPGADPATGDGPLVIRAGSVQGSPEFAGWMPLWSWFLWGLAILAVVVAAIVRAPKESDRWDRLRFVGWALGAVAWAVLAFVWHANFGRVLGVDATSPGLSGSSRLLLAGVEAATLLAMALMVVLPARLLLSRVFRLARQGRFMGLAGPAGTTVGILAGTPLLLGFVDLALRLFQ